MPYPNIHQWFHCNSRHAKRVVISDIPRMTPRFRYQQAIRLGSPIGSGVLTFHREDFLAAVLAFLLSNDNVVLHPFDALVLQWVKDFDERNSEPCLLPVGCSLESGRGIPERPEQGHRDSCEHRSGV